MIDAHLQHDSLASPAGIPNIDMVSDHACLLSFSQSISEATSKRIAQLTQHLKSVVGVVDLVPSYTTLLVVFDGDYYGRMAICKAIHQTIAAANQDDFVLDNLREVVLPVYYAQEVGFDLDCVAEHCQLGVAEVIKLHSERTYRAYAIGFTLGFAFLGITADALHIPRKATPRLKVPAGSVAIAENQSGVYPSATPGGWQIIGRTPVQLVDWDSDNIALIAMGDSVKFEPISRDEFLALGGQLGGV